MWVIFARSTRQARLEDGTVQLVGGLGGSEAVASPCEAKVGLMLQGCLLRSPCCEHLVAVKSQGSKRPSVSIGFQNFDDVDNAIYDQEIVLMCSVGIQMFSLQLGQSFRNQSTEEALTPPSGCSHARHSGGYSVFLTLNHNSLRVEAHLFSTRP